VATAAGGREVVDVLSTVALVTAAVVVTVADADFVTVVDVDVTAVAMLHDLVMPTWDACLPSSSAMIELRLYFGCAASSYPIF